MICLDKERSNVMKTIATITFFLLILSGCQQEIINEPISFEPTIPEYYLVGIQGDLAGPPNMDWVDEMPVETRITRLYEYKTFEELVLDGATDVVIAQYVRSQPFGDGYTEFEFKVSERLLGDATDRIFVYMYTGSAHVHGASRHIHYTPGDLVFEHGIDYLLPLGRMFTLHPTNPRDGDIFIFLRQTVINLDYPEESNMFSEALDYHVEGMDFTEDVDSGLIIGFVESLTEMVDTSRIWRQIIIDSSDVYEIITYSPYVLVIKLDELFSSGTSIWVSTDIFHITVIEELKGTGLHHQYQQYVTLPLGVANVGDVLIIGAQRIGDTTTEWFDLTTSSNYAIFNIEQLDEIRAILENN